MTSSRLALTKKERIVIALPAVSIAVSFFGGNLGKSFLNSPQLLSEAFLGAIALFFVLLMTFVMEVLKKADIEVWSLYRYRKYLPATDVTSD
jgi:hypothetical protein